MRDVMPLPAIPGLIAGHVGVAYSIGTAPRPYAIERLVVNLTDPSLSDLVSVDLMDGAVTLVSAVLGTAQGSIEVTPSEKVVIYAGREISMRLSTVDADAAGLSGRVEMVAYG